MPQPRRAILAALILIVLLPLHTGLAHAQTSATEYLALGDSLATGVGSSACPLGCASKGGGGYVADFAAALKQRNGSVTVKDLAVNGETTASLIGDYFTNPASKSQLARAVAAITGDGAKIGAITLDIGGNDALNHHGANHSTAEKQQVLAQAHANLLAIVSTLLTAVGSSGSAPRITLLGYYDPYGPSDPDLWALGALNQTIADTATQYGLGFAQPYAAFAGSEKSLTWIACSCPLNIHPNDQGYTLLANALDAATGGAAHATGSLTGTVRDSNGATVVDATVWYGGGSVLTDGNGVYHLDGVTAGVSLTLGAYSGDPTTSATVSTVAAAGTTLTQDFTLSGAAGAPAVYQQITNTRAGYASVVGALVRASIGQAAQQAAIAGEHAAAGAKHNPGSTAKNVLGRLGDAMHWLGQRFGG